MYQHSPPTKSLSQFHPNSRDQRLMETSLVVDVISAVSRMQCKQFWVMNYIIYHYRFQYISKHYFWHVLYCTYTLHGSYALIPCGIRNRTAE
ncbi:hypothetical protein SLEP1_g2440 [Rubroshorea leprosula]|uniref:Uncharacterized protein n=1 Tax=Rubroshorea leprosula TaxID=152421 RepID=A0AAV5HRD0_9ROSI|nr:hypothetical protein SLEP1_g2440 [Rubroshorea leprosula]